jgi:hypothetical protein
MRRAWNLARLGKNKNEYEGLVGKREFLGVNLTIILK